MRNIVKQIILIVFLMTVLLGASGCAVRYIADYDASIKDEIIQVAKDVDRFWGSLLDVQASDRKYERYKEQYNEIEADIRSLVMKNEIRALNRESIKQANIALELWMEDRSLHKKNDGFSDFEAKRHRKQFNRVFTAMAKGEEGKDISATKNHEGDK
jgi:hypothetical protein